MTAGTRAYSVGFQDGRFYANGWHITGEMGGIWAPPLKLADGVWFGVDDAWVGQATKFTSGRGYVRYDLPPLSGLNLRRTDVVPDGRRAVLYGLELGNPSNVAKTVTVKVDAHSELIGAYPWGFTGVAPNAADNLADTAAYENGTLVFTDRGTLPHPNADPHDYAALVGSDRRAESGETGPGFRGPQAGNVCVAQEAPSACDDGPFGKGAGGQLRYRVTVKPRDRETVWIAVAGSDLGVAAARRELAAVTRDPGRLLAEKAAARAELSARSQVDLPGDRQLQEAVDWGKQNIADLTQTATDLKIRYVDQGKQYPRPVATLRSATFVGAGYPDYPWLFATDGEYTAFASVAVGQFEAIKEHLIALRDISDAVNARSGKVAHEVVTDGSVWYGANSDPGNTDESTKFPSAVALLWRWTGDDRFRDALYDFSVRNLRYVTDTLDKDADGWPEGLGNVEREGMGEEKLDNTVYYVRGLYDLADMAADKGDRSTERWAREPRRSRPRALRREVVGRVRPPVRGLAGRRQARLSKALDRADADGGRADRRRRRRPRPGAVRARRDRPGRARERLLQRHAAAEPRPVPHGLRRRPDRRGRALGLLAQHRDPGRRRRQLRPRSASATRAPTPRRCSSPTSSPARCPRSCLHRTSRPTSRAAGRVARWSCRPGATTAPPGRSSTSSSVCARRWAPGRWKSCRMPPDSRIEGRSIRLGDGAVDVRAERQGRRL